MAEQTREERNREKRQLWASHIKSWEASGLTQIDYCRQNNLSRHRFTYWKSKYYRKTTPVSFVAISGKAIRPQVFHNHQTTLRLHIDGTYQIDIGDGFSPETLSSLIHTLGTI